MARFPSSKSEFDVRIVELQTVLEVFKGGSFAKAARATGVSTVTVLNRVSKVEKYFGVKLFERTPKGAVVTDAGRRVIEAIRELLEVVSDLKAAESSPARVEGLIKLSSSKLPSEYVLPCLISNFKARNESIDFELAVSDSASAVRSLELSLVDLAAIQLEEWARKGKFDAIKVAEIPLVVIASIHHELTLRKEVTVEALASQPLIMSSDRDLRLAVRRLFEAHGVDPSELDVKLTLSDAYSVVASVSQGLGVAIVPGVVARVAERAGLVRSVAISVRARESAIPLYLLKKRERPVEAVEHFWSFVKEMALRFRGRLPCIAKLYT